MDQVSPGYARAYVICAVIAALGATLRFQRKLTSGERLLSAALLCPLVIMFLIGMYRVGGVDYDNYLYAYNNPADQTIPDVGYTALNWMTRAIGIGFNGFLLLDGLFTIAVLWYVAKNRGADPVVVLFIYLCHLAIGRDLSQLRIGLAVCIFLLGLCQRRNSWKVLYFLAAVSVHATVVVLMFAWAYASITENFSTKKRWVWVYLPVLIFAAFGANVLQLAALVEPRVEIYLNWDAESFGAPLSSYSALVRSVTVVALFLAAERRFKGLSTQKYIVVELLAAAILLAFSQFAIFASRLSNVGISMYPIGLGVVAMACRQQPFRRRSGEAGLVLKSAMVATLVILLGRPSSMEALELVVPAIYETTPDWP